MEEMKKVASDTGEIRFIFCSPKENDAVICNE